MVIRMLNYSNTETYLMLVCMEHTMRNCISIQLSYFTTYIIPDRVRKIISKILISELQL